MQHHQIKLLALSLVFVIAGITIAARNQPKAQLPIKSAGKVDPTLDSLKPYRTWTKVNKQPIVLKLGAAAFAG